MAQSSVSVKADPFVSAKPFDAGALINVLVLVCFAFVIWFAVYLQKAPVAVPATAPPDVFSAGRALDDLKVIAAAAHPIGTTQHGAVRQYIAQRLSRLGLEPQVQTTTAVNSASNRAGTVNNILARLKGRNAGKALMLSTHYDSVPYGPGANDAGTGVAALLETARALKTGAQLKNDIIFLFTDGEEPGLLGALAFAKEHPWAKDVGLVLNFEARGNTGPSIMFESSNNNSWLIDGLSKAAPSPVSNSLAYEVYRLLPNDTDLTVFKGAGLPGLNFAYIGGLTHYHTRLDNLGNVDERSLQHHGSYSLALARYFGDADLTRPTRGNAVYFNILGTSLVHYSYAWNIPLAVFTLLLTIAVLLLGVRKRELTLRGIAWGTLVFVVALALSWVVVTAVWWLINLLSQWTSLFQNSAFRSQYYFLGFLALAAALFAGVVQWARKKTADANLFAGVLVCFALFVVPATLFLPGASYLFVWPLLGAGVALLIAFITTDSKSQSRLVILALGALPGLLLLGPTIYFLYTALVLSMPALLIVPAVLCFGLLTPALALPAVSKRWLLPAGFLAAGLVLLVVAGLHSGFTPNQPQRSDLFYALNADTGKAIWASADARLNDWTRQFLANGNRGDINQQFPSRNRTFLQSEAPAIQIPGPGVAVLKDETGSDVRRVQLRITSPRQAASLVVFVDGDVLQAGVNGKPITAPTSSRVPGGGWSMQYSGVPVEGFDLALELKPSQPLNIAVVDRTDGLPQSLSGSFKSRPADLIPSSNPFGDATFISRHITL